MEYRNVNLIKYGSTLFIALIIIVLIVMIKTCDYSSIYDAIISSDYRYIAVSVMCTACFIICESVNIKRILHSLGDNCTFSNALKYGACGYFFSGITPTSSGGQPMQLYYMSKDNIGISHGTVALLAELTTFQGANVTIGIIGLVYNYNYIMNLNFMIKVLLCIGMGINLAIFTFIALILFSDKAGKKTERFIKKLCIGRKEERKKILKVSAQMQEYRRCSKYLKSHMSVMLLNSVISMIQITAICSITYFSYKALGGVASNWLSTYSLQGLLNVSLSIIPLPGTVGAGEGGFRFLFSEIFTGGMIAPGVILSRGLSFYSGMIMSAGILLITSVKTIRISKL